MSKPQEAVSPAERRYWRKEINHLLGSGGEIIAGGLGSLVKDFYRQKKTPLIALARRHATPFYAYDRLAFEAAARSFRDAFRPHLPGGDFYYAVKVNPHPRLLRDAVKNGFGLDVSSARELKLALETGAKRMVFSGPGKSEDDLLLALHHRDKVVVHLDSFAELEKLGRLAARARRPVRAGVRIFTRHHGVWSKFGIPLTSLGDFFRRAESYPYVHLRGVQFHLSWNAGPEPYALVLRDLALYLKKNFSAPALTRLEFIDIGGGFLPHKTTAANPWGASPQADLIKKAAEYTSRAPIFLHSHYLTAGAPLASYAAGIGEALKKHFAFLPRLQYFAEPGRVIAGEAMHLVMRIADLKDPQTIIMDAGVNAVGWEGLRYDYTPLVDLSHFSPRERPAVVYGSLCMADDVWGHSIYASKPRPGDVVAVPNLGAYALTLAQNFIREIPKVYNLPF